MRLTRRYVRRRNTRLSALTLCVALLALFAAPIARADESKITKDIGKLLISTFLGVSGYWFTDSSAIHGLGSPKFGGVTSFYVKDAHRNGLMITGGIEIA